MKTFEGVIQEAAGNRIILTETGSGETLSLKAGAATLEQARAMVGRRVRFQAQLHESSIFLASPVFIVGSQYGLQAVAEPARESGVREIRDAAKVPSFALKSASSRPFRGA